MFLITPLCIMCNAFCDISLLDMSVCFVSCEKKKKYFTGSDMLKSTQLQPP